MAMVVAFSYVYVWLWFCYVTCSVITLNPKTLNPRG